MNGIGRSALVAFFCGAAAVYAQDPLIGKYTGSAAPVSNQREVALELEIREVAEGRVKATVKRFRGTCTGEFPMEGNREGDRVVLKTIPKDASQDGCGMTLQLKPEGSRLVGTIGSGGRAVELSK